MEKYKVTKGRFALKGTVYDIEQIVELSKKDEERLVKLGIIGDVLEKFVEKEKTEENQTPGNPPNPPGNPPNPNNQNNQKSIQELEKNLSEKDKKEYEKLLKDGIKKEDALKKIYS